MRIFARDAVALTYSQGNRSYLLVHRRHAEEHTVAKMCQTFNISRSSYYQWRKRKPSLHGRKDELLKQEILKIYPVAGATRTVRVSIATCAKLAQAAAEKGGTFKYESLALKPSIKNF